MSIRDRWIKYALQTVGHNGKTATVLLTEDEIWMQLQDLFSYRDDVAEFVVYEVGECLLSWTVEDSDHENE